MRLKQLLGVLIFITTVSVIYFYYAFQIKHSIVKRIQQNEAEITLNNKKIIQTSSTKSTTTSIKTTTTIANTITDNTTNNNILLTNSTTLSIEEQKRIEVENQIKEFYNKIAQRERKVFSQNREDGVIEAIFEILNIPDLKKYFVEIGTQSGAECNTRYLREVKKWTGLMFDGGHANPQINLNRETIHANTVVDMFKKYKIPSEIDFLSEDTDYADYWIVSAILTQYRPKVLAHEINQQTGEKCVTVPRSDELIFWDGANFHGGSVCAFHCLAKQNQYSMVYCESAGVNCFWIRNDIIEKYLKFKPEIVQKVLNPVFLHKIPGFVYPETGKKWHQVKC